MATCATERGAGEIPGRCREQPRSDSLGQTGLRVSRLAFGTVWMGPDGDDLSPEAGADLLCRAFSMGVSFWDTSDDYGTHPHVARALRSVPRDEVVLCSKTREAEGALERILSELGTDYLDILLMHEVALDWIEPARQALHALLSERAQGRVRALGLSTHSAAVARRAAAWPEVDVLMLPINRIGVCLPGSLIEDGGIAEMLAAAREAYAAGKGIVAMKVYGCGTLSHEGKAALSLASGLPFVHSLCIGIRSVDDLRQNLAWLEELEGANLRTAVSLRTVGGEAAPGEDIR